MLNWILNSISNYNKIKNQKKDIIQNLTDIQISEKFESYFMELFGCESCTKIIENYNEFDIKSNIINSIILHKKTKKENFKNEFELKNFIFSYIGKPCLNKKIVFFKFYKKKSKNTYNIFNLFGTFFYNKEENIKIYFHNFSERILYNHYYFDSITPAEKTLNLINKYSNSKPEYILFSNTQSYFYDFKENKIVFVQRLPVLKISDNELKIKKQEIEYFPLLERSYSIEFYLEINSINFCQKHKGTLYYGEHIMREFNFDIQNENDFINSIEKLLFPFFLPEDKKIELSLENVSLEQIKNTFDTEFELYKIAKL
jgi:hypothetical protein